MQYIADGNLLGARETTAQKILQVLLTTTQKLILEQKAALDPATAAMIARKYTGSPLTLGTKYELSNLVNSLQSDLTPVSTTSASWIVMKTITATAARKGVKFTEERNQTTADLGGVGITINDATTGTLFAFGVNASSTIHTKTFDINTNDVIRIWAWGHPGQPGITTVSNLYLMDDSATTGTISSLAITKDPMIGLRYWGNIRANFVAGAAGSTVKMKICNSAGTPLHTNFVTVAAAEYAHVPLERPVTLTATAAGQTVWNYTGLSNCDALINELGVLAKALLVELAPDGTTFSVLKEVTDYTEDISNILAPKITLTSGTGILLGTSKLRATYIVNIPLTNTTIKLQIQLNRLAAADISPSIQPLAADATKYVSGGQVAVT